MRNLVAAIVLKAVEDWKVRTDEVRAFFKSEWGKSLCEMIDLSTNTILKKLENREIQIKTEVC